MTKKSTTLILRFSSLGDVAMTVPVLRCITQKYPDDKFIFVTNDKFSPLFDEFENLEVFAVDFKKSYKGLFGLLKLFRNLLKIRPSKIVDLHSVIRTKIISVLFKLSGYQIASLDKNRRGRRLLTRKKNKIFKPLKSVQLLYQDTFNKIGYNIDLMRDHSFPRLAELSWANLYYDFRRSDYREDFWIGIAPFAKHKNKVYPFDLMQKLVELLSKKTFMYDGGAHRKFYLFLFGHGDSEAKLLEQLNGKDEYTFNINGRFAVPDTDNGFFFEEHEREPNKNDIFRSELELISNLNLMISMDSANGHLAANYAVPVITLWGHTHPYAGFTTFNYDSKNQFTVDREKFPMIPTSIYGNKTTNGYDDAMRTIKVDEIVKRVDEICEEWVED